MLNYILSQIQRLSREEQEQICSQLQESLYPSNERKKRMDYLVKTAEDCLHIKADLKSRLAKQVWLRSMVMYQLTQEHFTHQEVADYFKVKNQTPWYLITKLQEAIKHPNMYPDIIPAWESFKQRSS